MTGTHSIPLSAATPDSRPRLGRLGKVVREMVSIIFWLYALLSLFLFDFDTYLILRYLPSQEWVLFMRLGIILLSAAVVFVFLPRPLAFSFLLYIIFYPLVLVFFQFPRLIVYYDLWAIALVALSGLLSVFYSIRYHCLSKGALIVAASICLFSTNRLMLACSAIALGLVLLASIGRHVWRALWAGQAFSFYAKFAATMRVHGVKQWPDNDPLKLVPYAELSATQLSTWRNGLEISLVSNRACLFLANIFRDYHKSHVPALIIAASIIHLWIYTILLYSFMYFAVYKLDNQLFYISGDPSFTLFLVYSFKASIFATTSAVSAVGGIALGLEVSQNLSAVFILIFFISVLFTLHTRRASEDLDALVRALDDERRATEALIVENYKVSDSDEAARILETLESSFVQLIAFLARRTRP